MNRNSWDFKEELLHTFHIQEKTKTLWRVDKGIKHKHSKPDTHEWTGDELWNRGLRLWPVLHSTQINNLQYSQVPCLQAAQCVQEEFRRLAYFFSIVLWTSAENMLKIHCKPVHHHSLLQYRQMNFCTLWVCLHSLYCSLFILWKQMWSPSSRKLDFNQVFNNGRLLHCKSLFLS